MDTDEVKQRLCDEVDRRADQLLSISHQIHGNPELGDEEVFAHRLLVDAVRGAGLDVDPAPAAVPTAFVADAGVTGPTVAVICEYDALPDIGHACGHNVIAAAGLGAGLAAASVAEELGGRVRIVGTPAEEGGGGKVRLLEGGVFDDVDAAMMVHPAWADLRTMEAIAIRQLLVTYHGQAAHAAAAPWQGRNALDGAVLGYMNVAALRQHLQASERVHGVFTDGGAKPNVVPHRAAMHWYVRAATLTELDQLCERVLACLAAGALASGCELEHQWLEPAYAEMVDNTALVELYVANAARLGRQVREADGATKVVGSTDMGNVSHVVASMHPMIAVAPPGVAIHTPEFALHAGGSGGDRAVLDGAKAMAMTVADLWADPGALTTVRSPSTS